ncbi:AAA domain-containing protein [Cytobacillus horneckiae]|uniref:AAA domain-containing protein n=1 Tax=Cytobacillus horneckiae TaxID=549687 RepID=UPI00203B55DE|nr:AAA domain-containing protein [Cytobacillus horneckiae]MCM3177674.1 AAA domain-containing protein [Cytobacillus horneckiae]
MTTTGVYIKEWQSAIKAEIGYMKKFGNNKYRIEQGQLLQKNDGFTYFFDTVAPVNIPVGSKVKLEWGGKTAKGRILSSEGKNIIIKLEEYLGDIISEVIVSYDPWELLDELFQRLSEIKTSKKKRSRIKRLLNPGNEVKHPVDKIKSNVHELILRSKYNPVTYVWGPPGTGKTYTLARVAANKYFKNQKVLVLSHSNQAVDVLLAEISQFTMDKNRFKRGELLRYGSQNGSMLLKHPELTTDYLMKKNDYHLTKKKNELLEERRKLKQDLSFSFSKRDSEQLLEVEKKIGQLFDKIKQKELEFVKEAKVLGTTLAKAATDSSIFENEFDLVIVDEASMAYVPQAAFAASLGKRVIICGDFKQLPPIAAAKHELVNKWLREDVFHHAGVAETVNKSGLHPHLFLLKEQRRMHPDISSFTNKYIYHSLVGDHPEVKKNRKTITARLPFTGRASIFLNTAGAGRYCIRDSQTQSRANLWQLLLSFQLIYEAYLDGARSIGYVTPFRVQALLMERLLEENFKEEIQTADILSATVHRFQGSEREMMIFDTVDSTPERRPGMLLTGKDSERLLNVAITRTKGKFIHVGDYSFIRQKVSYHKIWRKLADFQIANNQDVHPQEIGKWIKNMHPKLQWMHARKTELMFNDILAAKNSLYICLPESKNFPEQWIKIINCIKPGISITIFSENKLAGIKNHNWSNNPLSFPFILIDEMIVWVGVPIEGLKDGQPPYVAARAQSNVLASFIIQQLNG